MEDSKELASFRRLWSEIYYVPVDLSCSPKPFLSGTNGRATKLENMFVTICPHPQVERYALLVICYKTSFSDVFLVVETLPSRQLLVYGPSCLEPCNVTIAPSEMEEKG